MSQEYDKQKSNRVEPLPPLVSAADVNEANYPRARFDESIAWTIKETARQRAPTRESVWNHQVGFAGEVTSSAYFGVKADWDIHPDYVGDDGFDLDVGGKRIETKTVTRRDELELRVPTENVDSADYFVLAQCSHPQELVQLIGWISRPRLLYSGHRFDGDIRVGTEHLLPFEPLFLPPERIRATQQ